MSEGSTIYVIDSFALLAYLEGESGAKRVEELLHRAKNNRTQLYLSLINLGEILYITEREQGLVASRKALAAIDQLPIALVAADRDLALTAAHIKAQHPISYTDAFAVALALQKEATVLTGDPEFKCVESLAAVEWLPR